MHVDYWVFVGLNEGVHEDESVQATYVDYHVSIKYVTNYDTVHLRVTTMIIISSARFLYCHV